ncbi:unnamed protein product [Pocillopora meandrina]|uniref:Uncharacterized protein n=1 Tax=Pocillopora meandrina TaxID=46732 RepID=A0AAU9W363_9CNID|nr:unnamed protein product [Pocillopora meandrina]
MAEKLDAVSLNNVNWLLIRRCPQVPVRYQTIPSLVTQNAKLPPRLFPYNLPIGPRRPFSVISRPPALGIGNIRGLEENKKNELSTEESSGTFQPIEIESKSEKELQVLPFVGDEELPARKNEAVTLPEHEKNADLVRYRAVRYEPRPEIWQKVACVWDQVQTRPNQFHQYESDSLFPAISASTVRSEEREKEQIKAVQPAEQTVGMPKLPEGGEERNIKFTRPTPGYGGYISRYPEEPRPPQGSWDEVFVNFSKLTYRSYPSYEYTKEEFAHEGPLSRLVTTTHPSNPFNKVDKWSSRPKKLCKRTDHSKFIFVN